VRRAVTPVPVLDGAGLDWGESPWGRG